ncbi:MAG: hypothetical protein QM766_23230 [Burkholderiaceae bacterium]
MGIRALALVSLALVLIGAAPALHAAGPPGMRLAPDERERLRGELRDQPWHRREPRFGPDGQNGGAGPRHFGGPGPAFAPGSFGAPAMAPSGGPRDPGRGWAPASDAGWDRHGPPPEPARLSPDERRELRRQLRDVNRSAR